MKNIGIDIGTTTISVVVIDTESSNVEQKYTVSNGSFINTEYSWERIQDVDLIMSKVTTILKEILSQYKDIVSIGLTGQMHGIVYVNQEGYAVSPLYTWQDQRGNIPFDNERSLCSILQEDYHIKAATGYGMVTHLYNQIRQLIPDNAVSFCTIGDYLGMALTGRKSPLLHISQAAGMGFYNVDTCNFDMQLIKTVGIDATFLPSVTPEITTLGTFRNIPVSVSLGDNQASFLGSVKDGDNTVLVNVGTGAQISVLSNRSFSGNGIETRPLSEELFLLVGSTICGGAAYAALEKFFREYAVAAGAPDTLQFDIMKFFLEQEDSEDNWSVETTFSGTRDNPNVKGSISGITLTNFHPVSLIRGVLSGMSNELYDLYEAIHDGTGVQKTKLLASGNGVRRNKFLQDILSKRFNMSLEVEKNEEEAAYGAAISSMIAIGDKTLENCLGK